MYTSFLGFKEKPFNLTPDPRYLFLSSYHKEALDHMLYGINERKGFIAITGGIGTGKTTLCRALLGHLDASTKTALIFNSFISEEELLKAINQEFDVKMDPAAESRKDYTDALNDFLIKNFASGGNAVLLIDEAQNLSQSVLEQIRMLSNLETEREKLIQIVLVGQSELKELLATPSLRQLDERITVRYELRPLDRSDLQSYVEHRLVVGGNWGSLRFKRGAFKEIYGYSQGNPRRINAVCDRALLIAYAREKHTVSKAMVREATESFRKSIMIDPLLVVWPRRMVDSVTILLFLLIMVAAFAGWNLRHNIVSLFLGEKEVAAVVPKFASPMPPKPKKEPATLFLDEKTSFAGLFDLFMSESAKKSSDISDGHLGLASFIVEAEYYVMFKKPFRVYSTNSVPTSLRFPRYLLIRQITEKGAIVLDAGGKNCKVSRDFILKHWGRKVSWVYPYRNKHINLIRGMSVPDVLKVQTTLRQMGYLVEPTGVYDEPTFREVVKFQRDFGLNTDGIVGPRTLTLLYQMSD